MIFLKWNLQWIVKQKDGRFDFDETLSFPSEMFHNLSQINGLKDVNVTGQGRLDMKNRQLYVDFKVKGQMILPCAVSLEDVDYPFEIDSTAIFAFYKPQEDEDVIEAKRDMVDLTPVIFQEIMMDVPMRVVKEGATLKTKGNGWKVLNEEDESRDEDYIDPRLAKLKDYFKDKE
ncbi:MAG: YceD family protein [Longibaculum sp.]